MLAYLFFHRAAAGIDVRDYEERLRRFHAALADATLPGFGGSRTYRIGDGYCDWYLVETSAALDAMNDAAVTGPRSFAHDAVAHHAVDFAGKLLKLAAGAYDLDAGHEIRLSKPHGMTYPDFYKLLKPWTDRPDVSLWRRMLVLGPPPEFCLLSRSKQKLPAEMEPKALIRDAV